MLASSSDDTIRTSKHFYNIDLEIDNGCLRIISSKCLIPLKRRGNNRLHSVSHIDIDSPFKEDGVRQDPG